MDQETKKIVNGLPIDSLNTLEISGDKWKSTSFKTYKNKKNISSNIATSPAKCFMLKNKNLVQ